MKFILIDTTTPLAAISAVNTKKVVTVPFGDRYNQSRDLPKLLQRALRQAHLILEALDVVVVVTGPGSFTSIRVGVSFANALAYGEGIPVLGISLFDWAAAIAPAARLLVDCGPSGIFQRRGSVITRYTQEEYAQLPKKARGATIPLDLASLVALATKKAPGALKAHKAFVPVVPFYGSKPNITTPKRARKKR